MNPEQARLRLIQVLQNAYSGELAAIHAYRGHRWSVRKPSEKEEILAIELQELAHRECVGKMLERMGARPRAGHEIKMGIIGRLIGYLCLIGGWFIPMYGAGRLERKNIGEYEEAAHCALVCGELELLEGLLHMAEVEWDHEKYFREKIQYSRLYGIFPKWSLPPPRASIRAPYLEKGFLAAPTQH